MFTFSEMLALVQSESSFGAFVCHRRPAGLQATSDLVAIMAMRNYLEKRERNDKKMQKLPGVRVKSQEGFF